MNFFKFMHEIRFRFYLIIALAIISSSLIVFTVVYNTFYSMTISDLQEKTKVVNKYAQTNVPVESFDILQKPSDSVTEVYQKIQETLNEIRQIANVRYLFTAKYNENKEPVYVVDGLDPSSFDFRFTGDLIEPDILPMLHQCLNGEKVEVDDILYTEWGAIFITCWPVKNLSGDTKGAMVMEFDAEHFYNNNKENKVYSLIVSFLISLIFFVIGSLALKKMLLNPLFGIEAAVRSLPNDGFTARVPENASTLEMLSLQKTFNVMAAQACENIQKIKEAEAARVRAEDVSQAKSEFLANMSHEVRTPMNGVIGMIHLVMQNELSENQRDYLQQADKSAKMLLGILNDILDFSKIEANMMRLEVCPFDLQSLVKNSIDLISHTSKNIEINYTFDSNIPSVLEGDELRIGQILNNLFSNALKFTSDGQINVDCKLIDISESTAVISVSVEDTGIGMSSEQLQKVFLPFTQADLSTTRQYGGTGLGLSIVKMLVEMMGGTVSVRSSLGKGSIFSFILSFNHGSDTSEFFDCISSELPCTPASVSIQGLLVLLAEDNDINEMIATEILTQQGCVVDVAHDGIEAVAMVYSKKYDIVLMDIQMPNMDGLEATRKIREDQQFADLPIVAMTAHAMNEDYEKSFNAGMQDYITKPVDLNKLFHSIARWCHRK